MASLPVYDKTGKKVGDYDVDPADFAATINTQLLHDVVVMYQASARQGTQKTKSRSEVRGSTRKLYRQKGTGNARAGSRRSNIRRGGGQGLAIRPRDYSYRLPRKAVRLATRMAMAGKIQDAEVIVLEGFTFDEPKTKEVASLLKALELVGMRALIATAAHEPMVYKSARNIDGVKVSCVGDLNAFEILHPDRVLITREAINQMKENAAAAGKKQKVGV